VLVGVTKIPLFFSFFPFLALFSDDREFPVVVSFATFTFEIFVRTISTATTGKNTFAVAQIELADRVRQWGWLDEGLELAAGQYPRWSKSQVK
jgi:hypothetical protein